MNGMMAQISLKSEDFIFITYAKNKVNINICELYKTYRTENGDDSAVKCVTLFNVPIKD